MRIESIIRRHGGTVVELDGVTYEFKPEERDGPHVCDVTDEDHIRRFLAIPEGYRALDAADAVPPAEVVAPKQYSSMKKAELAELIIEAGKFDGTVGELVTKHSKRELIDILMAD